MKTLPIAACLLLLAGCATTRQVETKESGFLGDYSQLQVGAEGQPRQRFEDPDADFARYRSVIIDSVGLWYHDEASKLPPEDEKALTDYLYIALHRELGRDYEIVTEPGPDVLRVRAAITEARGARVVANTVTSVIPQLRLLSTLTGMATGTTALVGRAGIELELVDSTSGERLFAAVDGRVGTKAVRGGIGEWSQVRGAFDTWAALLAKGLRQRRAAAP